MKTLLAETRSVSRMAEKISVRTAAAAMASFILVASPCGAQNSYTQHNLVSDIPGLADHNDPNLVNPWGIATSATSPFWVSDNHSGLSTLYNTSGMPLGLVVTVPPASGTGPGSPTGIVFNGNSADFSGSHFIFATEDGTISSWTSGTSAVFQTSRTDAVYKGLALGNNGSGNFLYAANFSAGTIDAFNSTFGLTMLAGHFTDPNLPSGYAPFNIQNVNGSLLVTYALQDADKEDDVAGAGHGFLDRFDLNGNFLERLATGGVLNSPWGLALAPAGFGVFGGDLLVGNFGDGRINAFDPITGVFLGTLDDTTGNPIEIEGLWGLRFGNGGNGGDPAVLYFTAGIPGPDELEDHGLFGSISTPDGGRTITLMILGLIGLAFCARRFHHAIC